MKLVYAVCTALWFWLILSVVNVMLNNSGGVIASWNFFLVVF